MLRREASAEFNTAFPLKFTKLAPRFSRVGIEHYSRGCEPQGRQLDCKHVAVFSLSIMDYGSFCGRFIEKYKYLW